MQNKIKRKMSSNNLLSEIYDYVLNLTIEIGEIMKEGFNSDLNIETKDDSWDVVTEYDRRIENYLIEHISKKYPSHKFIAEETSSKLTSENVLTDEPTWIIDPIDGTSNYTHRCSTTAISIGFLIDKEILIGIVYAPMKNELFTATKGNGSFLNGTKIHSSKITSTGKALVCHEVSMARDVKLREKNMKRFLAIVSNSQGVRSFGCPVLSQCYVANGTLDAYHVDDLFPWDMAAGVLIVREAGGFVLNSNGSEFDIMKPNIICAGTENLCREIISLLN